MNKYYTTQYTYILKEKREILMFKDLRIYIAKTTQCNT